MLFNDITIFLDTQIEYQINDKLSFMRFLNLTLANDILYSKTVWQLTDRFKDLSLTKALSNLFGKELEICILEMS